MSRVPRHRALALDDRTGFMVPARKLREDGEIRGLRTVDPDPEHPQKYAYPPGPDGLGRERGTARRESHDVIVCVGLLGGLDDEYRRQTPYVAVCDDISKRYDLGLVVSDVTVDATPSVVTAMDNLTGTGIGMGAWGVSYLGGP